MKVVSTKLSNPVWERLVDKCNTKGVTLAEQMRLLIEQDLNELDTTNQNGRTEVDDHPVKTSRPSPLLQLFPKKRLDQK